MSKQQKQGSNKYGEHYNFNIECIQVSDDAFCKSISEEYTSIIPSGLTKHLQPVDVSWNKPFKQQKVL